MAIDLRCEDCDLTYRVPERAAGKRVKCRQCERLLLVPGPPAAARKPRQADPGKVDADEERDRALFGEAIEFEAAPVPGRPRTPRPSPKPLPPKDPPSAVRGLADKKTSRRRLGPQVGGSLKDKFVFAGGVLGVLRLLAVFAPFVLYLVGLGFYWLAYIWVVGDAYEENSDGKPVTGSLFTMFRLLTRPLHLWPAWLFLGLGILAMLIASQRLPWLVDSV